MTSPGIALRRLVGINFSIIFLMEKSSLTDDKFLADPSVFNFYIYLRTHPLLVRQQLASVAKGSLVVTSVPSRHAPGLPNSHVSTIDEFPHELFL